MLDKPGEFSYRDGVAIIQLIFFGLYLGFAFVLCWRHGFRRSEGWVILATFSILRILGASFQLATINNPSRTTYGGALICQGIGLAPLTLLSMGLFARVNKWVNVISPKIFTVISLVGFAGIAVAIYGGTESANSPTLESNSLLKASVLLFLACYIAFVVIFLIFLRRWHDIPKGERSLLICFACCAPFMVVRFLFGIIGTFVDSLRPQFSVLTGDVTTFLCMAVLEEIIVVGLIVFTGMRLDRLPAELRKAPPKDTENQSRSLFGRRRRR